MLALILSLRSCAVIAVGPPRAAADVACLAADHIASLCLAIWGGSNCSRSVAAVPEAGEATGVRASKWHMMDCWQLRQQTASVRTCS